MNTIKRGHIIRPSISILILTGWILLISCVSIAAYPSESVRLPGNPGLGADAALSVPAVTTEQENTTERSAVTVTGDGEIAKWTFMIYMGADDDRLEEAVIDDFTEMADIGSSEFVNVVVQLDRISTDDHSYGDWSDCRRFLITKGLTPDDGNEISSIGEVNMGDPATLVSFVEWASSNFPAEKYALIISGHGKGWEGTCWDKTSGNDNMNLAEMGNALSEISEFIGRPLDLIGFDACLMGTMEVAYELQGYASVMVASEQTEPASGWPYDTILTQLNAASDMDAAELATITVDSYYLAHSPTSYTMAALDLTKIGAVVSNLDEMAKASLRYDITNTNTVKDYAITVITALDEAFIYEKHGAAWPGSHGLAIYFPKYEDGFTSGYNADNVSIAADTTWEEFVIGFYQYESDSWIAEARDGTQQYYCSRTIDLYDFCQHLIDSE